MTVAVLTLATSRLMVSPKMQWRAAVTTSVVPWTLIDTESVLPEKRNVDLAVSIVKSQEYNHGKRVIRIFYIKEK